MTEIRHAPPAHTLALALVLAASLALLAADTARRREAQPPHQLFDSGEAALLRCRHLAPRPDHYARAGGSGHPRVPRYDYDAAAHDACLEETRAWFEVTHPEAKAEHPHLFAEAICAVPPPQYTNIQD